MSIALLVLLALAQINFQVPSVKASPVYEDFTSYTEKDDNNHINKTANHIDFDCYRNEDAWLYDDKGANHFSTFTHNIDVNITETPDLSDVFIFYMLSNDINDLNYLRENDKPFVVVYFQRVAAEYHIYFGVGNATGDTFDYYEGWTENTPYYFTISRNATNATCKIYEDADRTSLIDALTVAKATRDAGDLRYIFAACTYNIGGAYSLEGDIDNLDLQEVNTVNLNSPANGATKTAWAVDFKFTPIFYQAIENASFHTNETDWSTNHWNTTVVQNNTQNTINYTFSSEGTYIWNIQTFNSTDSVWATSNFTVTIDLEYTVVFYGLYNETTGLLTGSVNVTAFFTDGTSPETFEVNGNYSYGWEETKPQYFLFELGDKDRQYWLREGEDSATIYIFSDTFTTYTVEFLDLAGVTDARPIVEAKYYVNGTTYIVDRRKVDVEPKIVMNLVNGRKYVITILDGATYTFGELLMTSDTTITLTLKGVEFTQENLLTFRWIQIQCVRTFSNPNGTVTLTYNDTLTETTQVTIQLKYRNGTSAYNGTETADSFVHTWPYALNNSDYQVEATIIHASLGTLNAEWFLPRSLTTAPWALDFLGTLPFATSTLLPMFLVLCFAGLFSALNAPLGAFLTVMATIIFVYLGWISVSGGALIAALAFALMLAIVYAKRRANV